MDGNQDDDNEEDEEGDEGAAAPSSLPAPALIMGAAVTNFHVAGAAPQFAQGKNITLQSLCGLLGASLGPLGGFLDSSFDFRSLAIATSRSTFSDGSAKLG